MAALCGSSLTIFSASSNALAAFLAFARAMAAATAAFCHQQGHQFVALHSLFAQRYLML
ncbi:hypothetical protein P20429_3043 [Pseudoalteromonas sp. BSi20429]|nr:hypothetical protein P20429_3043 [Pseudoalteromonas sp. BSi20429]